MTAADVTAATSPPVGDPVIDPSTNGFGAPTARRRFSGRTATQTATETAPVAVDGVESRGADAPRKLTRKERRDLGRLRARKVHRVVRHFDPWSVLKVSLVFYFCFFVVLMVAGVVLWNLAAAAGTISDIEGFFKDAGAFQTFSFDGYVIFRATFLIGLILVIAATALTVLLAVLFNLISDLVGGVRITVIEEESARPLSATQNLRP